MPEILGNVARDTMSRMAKRGAASLNKDAVAIADRAVSKSLGSMGKDVLATSGAKAQQNLQEFVRPHVIRVAHDPAKIPTAAEAATMDKTMTAGLQRASEEMLKLTPDEQEVYRNLGRTMDGRIDGQLALQQLLIDGRLTMASSKDPARNLIGALGDLSKQDLAPGIDRKTFLAQLHQELADPIAVSQEHKGTCAATSSGQIFWSMREPTDYTDFLRGLASPEGKAQLPSGEWVQRPADWRAGNDRSLGRGLRPGQARNEGRTISSELTEPVFMQVGIGPKFRYSNTFDAGFDNKMPGVKVDEGGLADEQSARLMSKLFPGEDFTIVYHSPAELKDSLAAIPKKEWPGERIVMTKDKMIDMLAGSASPESPVRASVDYELSGGHAILVTSVENRRVHVPGKKALQDEQWVHYINPWGRLETQRRDAFKMVLDSVITSNGTIPVKV